MNQPSGHFHRYLPLALVLLVAAVAAGIWYFTLPDSSRQNAAEEEFTPDPPTADPRLVFDSPFRNVKPAVQYVGDAACADCHGKICKSFHAHPMGRSAARLPDPHPFERYDRSGRTTFTASGFDFEIERTAKAVRHRVRLHQEGEARGPELNLPADVAIGSGTRGRSYLAIEGDAVWQTPISWFGPEQRWDVSPGFRLGQGARRTIVPGCLYCHVDQVKPVPGAENRYLVPVFANQLAIGCERCHGPGSLHVAERAGGAEVAGIDTSIVNPRHLGPELQSAICEQCHLQGEVRVNRRGRDVFEFRPGLPFEQFVSVFVKDSRIASAHRSVGQFEQMEQSQCFAKSGGKLQCTSCHDPHMAPAPEARDAHYRSRCMTCHDSHGCSASADLRATKNDSCISCHMPKAASTNVIHASVTDHRVPRKPGTREVHSTIPMGASPLVRFRAGPFSPPPEELDRDLGIALAHFSKKPFPPEVADLANVRSLAVEHLTASTRRWRGDAEAWLSLATVRTERGEAHDKLRAAAAAVKLDPNSEAALAELAEAASALGQYDTALEAITQWLRVNPRGLHPLMSRAFIHLSRREWEKVEADARAAIAIQPLHPDAHIYLAISLHKRGDLAGGQRESRLAASLESSPKERAFLLNWYRTATK